MNFLQLKNRVALIVDNIKAGDPHYDAMLGDVVNDALREVPKRVIHAYSQSLNMFPELRTFWTVKTTASDVTVTIPATALTITAIFYIDDDGVSWPGDSVGKLTEVIYKDPESFELLDKDNPTGYPKVWSIINNEIVIWPVPSADYICWLKIHGLLQQADLSGDTDTPVLSVQWHYASCLYAAYLLCLAKGYFDRAKMYISAFDEIIGRAVDPTGILLAHQRYGLKIMGSPSEDW